MAESRGKAEHVFGRDREVEGAVRPAAPNPRDTATTGEVHPAGPHAAPELTDAGRTPGAGALPDPKAEDESDAGTG